MIKVLYNKCGEEIMSVAGEDSIKPSYRAPLSERFVVRLRNLWHWRTAWAVRHLSKQLQRDREFRQSWHANIAMPIHDCTRGHHPTHWKIDGGGVAIAVRYMPIDQCNYIADKLMKHLFNA